MSDLSFKDYPVKEGQTLYHLYTMKYGATGFNASGVQFRFSPIPLSDGSFLPTYYAAIDQIDVFSETIIRRYRNRPTLRWNYFDESENDIKKGNIRAIAQVQTTRRLKLIDLQTLQNTLGDNPIKKQLVRSNKDAYSVLRGTAKYLYENVNGYDGLCWDGYQMRTPGKRCMMLFGKSNVLSALEETLSDPLRQPDNLLILYDALRALKVEVPAWLFSLIDR